MRTNATRDRRSIATLCLSAAILLQTWGVAFAQQAPAPLIDKSKPPVEWWFAFKFNTASFPNCAAHAVRKCLFGGTVQNYDQGFSQQFVFASGGGNGGSSLRAGNVCLGDTTEDPVGATFDQVYNGPYNYVLWNDQFYNDPDLPACQHHTDCASPWAHSKGMLAWDNDGNGFVMQVSTPNWPGAGSKLHPRQTNGNTLGCIAKSDGSPHDNVLVSQHFFAVRLNKDDVVLVLKALQKASVVTKQNAAPGSSSQIVKNGGPADIQQLVRGLGRLSEDTEFSKDTLSSGVQLITKPPMLHVPPWQMVSAILGKEPLIVATWLTEPHKISNTKASKPACWDPSLGTPGSVTNAESGHWKNKAFGLTGSAKPNFNHAKLGVSKTGDFAIFGDLNQAGALSEPCDVPQNTRGGLFFVVQDQPLAQGLRSLMNAPVAIAALTTSKKLKGTQPLLRTAKLQSQLNTANKPQPQLKVAKKSQRPIKVSQKGHPQMMKKRIGVKPAQAETPAEQPWPVWPLGPGCFAPPGSAERPSWCR